MSLKMQKQSKNLLYQSILREFFKNYKSFIPPIIISIVLIAFGQIINPGFASLENIGNILAIASILCIGSVGQTLVIISGGDGIDLSLGALMSMGAVVGSGVLQGLDIRLPLTIITLIGLGAGFGFVNGTGIWWLGIPPLVMTLAMSSVIDGFTLAVSQGRPFGSASPLVLAIGGGRIFGFLRWLVIIAILFILFIDWYLLNKTKYGKSLFLVGNNRIAARICGINNRNIILLTYVLAGILGSIAGFFLLSSVGTAQMQMGSNYTMLSVAAVVLGGTQLSGGKGSYLGTALGSVVLIALTNVLIAIGMAPGVRMLVTGIVLVCILVAYTRQPQLRQ